MIIMNAMFRVRFIEYKRLGWDYHPRPCSAKAGALPLGYRASPRRGKQKQKRFNGKHLSLYILIKDEKGSKAGY